MYSFRVVSSSGVSGTDHTALGNTPELAVSILDGEHADLTFWLTLSSPPYQCMMPLSDSSGIRLLIRALRDLAL